MISQKEIWDKIYSKEENKWKRESKSFNGVLRGKEVLELGVGNGKTLKSLIKDKPKFVYAVDFSNKAIEICKKEFKKNKIKLFVADVTKLPFEDKKFDYVICYYLLNNLNYLQQKKVIYEMYRVLKEKGKILFEDFAKGDFRDDGKSDKSGLIKHYFFIKEIKDLFYDFKIEKLKIKEFNTIRSDKKLKRRIINCTFRK